MKYLLLLVATLTFVSTTSATLQSADGCDGACSPCAAELLRRIGGLLQPGIKAESVLRMTARPRAVCRRGRWPQDQSRLHGNHRSPASLTLARSFR